MSDAEDPRFKYIYRLVAQAFRHITVDKINEYWGGELVRRLVFEFLDGTELQAIFFREAKGSIEISDQPMKSSKATLFYIVKLDKNPVTEEGIVRDVLFGDLSADPIENIAMMTEMVYHPIIESRGAGQVWPETIAKEIRENFESFFANIQITQGHMQGVTCLPLPSSGGVAGKADEDGESGGSNHHIHSLESAIINWTKQIKNVLKQDPETALSTNPGPLAEIEFWKSKAINLNGIFNQLQSSRVRRILKVLDKSKSTYNAPFAKLCKEVFHARAEANNIIKYLQPLLAWFQGLEEENEFTDIVNYFKPIVHLCLLIWKASAYYNTPGRLVVLLRQICNTMIKKASEYLRGDEIFDKIDANEISDVVKMLQHTLRVFGKFKSTYFEYKSKASVECPDNPWKIQNNAIFVRFDGFLERCHDILDLAQTIMMFSKLQKIEIGGGKGKTLTTSVTQIYLDFTQAVDHVRAVGRGILDIENKEFENSFYDFRTRVKELDRRVGSVIVQGFDDAYTVGGRFKLLDSFDSLLLRPIIADALEKKHAALITGIADEIADIQKNFVDRNENPPISNNLPPIAGALTWSRGLLERAQLPIEKLKSLDRKILERDDAREVIKVYTALISYLADFENDKIKAWGARIEDSSQAKLRNPLLMRSAENAVADDGRPIEEALLNVNFDPLLVRLLREVKYFLLLNLDIPQSAMDVFKMYETFRRYTGNLDLVVNMYNTIQLSLLPVERPLVRPQLERIDKILAKGIGDSRDKSKGLNWKSTGIELFIGEAMTEAKEVTELLTLLKGTLKQVEGIVDSWRVAPIFERMSKTSSIDDFILLQKKVRQARIAVIKESGNEVHKLLKESNKRLKVSQGSPDWRAYTDFINDIVVAGLVESVLVSLKTMGNQFNPKFLENLSLASLLEIHCDLINKEITFIPEVGFVADIEDRKSTGVKNLAISWINGMLGVCGAFKRVDTGEGTYLRELSDHPAVQIQRSQIYRLLKAFEDSANDLRKQFQKFEYLWLTDMQAIFSAFIREAVVIEEVEFAEIDETAAAGAATSSGGATANKQETDGSSSGGSRGTWKKTVMNLEMFADKLLHYLTVQKDISDLKAIYDVDFIKINAQPVKQAMATWATKWLYSFSSYLQVHLGSKLNELYNFMKAVNGGLDVPLEGISRDAVMKVMSHIRDVRKRTPEIESLFEPQRDIVMMLKKHSITIDLDPIGGQSALEFLENSKMFWDGTVNKAYRVKESIQPIQNSMLEGIRKDIKAFDSSVQKFAKEFRLSSAFQWQDSRYKDVYAIMDKTFLQILSFKEKGKSLNELEDLFELPMSKLTILKDIEEELRLLKCTWDVVVMVDSFYSVWKSTLWADINTELLLDEVRVLQNQIKKQPKITKDWSVTKNLELQVKNLATVLPLVHELHSPAMRDRHWKNVMLTTATSFERGPSFSLQDLLNLNLHKFVEPVMDIVEMATKELKIESKLTMIEDTWHKLALIFDRHRDTEVYIILPPDDILETLEEHSLQLQSISGMGRFVEFFKSEVTKWLSTLGEVDTNLKLLLIVQRQWGSLESIFLGSADIRSQLPDDTKRFETVDNEFKEMMREVQAKPGVVVCCSADGREATLTNMFKELEKCEKALNEYLEIKKSIFPRFYFVSNAALLDILSNGNNPPKIMPHVGSVFDGIGDLSLCLSSNQLNAIAEAEKLGEKANTGPFEAAKSMISKDREVVNFPALFEMRGAVEFWLNELVRYMQVTLRGVLAASNTEAVSWDTDKPREEWVFNFPAQITLVSSQITWTEEVERSLEELEAGQEDSVKKYCETCTARINALISLVQGELTKGDRVKIITVITIDVHNRDVVQTLVTKKVENNLDFKWQSQLKFYWNVEERNVNIRICDFSTQYSFEYVGNCGRLVITPLTDRCYVTLTVALRLMLGGAPAGPAGTGKTETTKDLARGLGLPCYVFNCSDQMNYQTMGDIFKGLTQVGAWGCFDEFNRIDIEVLSVVASQVKSILDAITLLAVPANRSKEFMNLPAGTPPVKIGSFDFFGSTISLIPTVGLFITMNPGYAGRTELPENLKALFRSCAMIQPDLLPIAENMLMSEGFQLARPLSIKFVTLYKLCSELLSKQHHYDWGLRAIKSVLRVAGVLKRADPDLKEEAILMRALRDFNTPKIPNNDIPIFLRLISDLFPGLDLAPKVNDSLRKICIEVCKASNLRAEEVFVGKVMQFEELLDVRHSVFLLGPAGCGKSSVWKTLAAANNHGKSKVIALYETVNPKSVTTDELYGYMTLTKDWRDGVLSIIMRNMSKNVSPYQPNQTSKWVVLDGDIDSLWIESMNTVMDDNKVLTLVSNERIPLTDAMRMVFEIHSLRNATPATVSRAGILYINDTDVGYQPFIDSWLLNRTVDAEKSLLPDLFDRYLNKVIEYFTTTKTEGIIPSSYINMVQSLCYILDGLLSVVTCEKNQQTMERMFIFSLMWAFGGSLAAEKQTDNRKTFSLFFKGLVVKSFKFPDAGVVLDYTIDFATGEPVAWQDKVSAYSSGAEISQSSVFVPTADTVRLSYLMGLLVKKQRPIMFVGSAGTGKTVLVADYLSGLSTEGEYKYTSINMNYYTDSYALQMQLEQSIDKRSGKAYGPPGGKLVYFVDDLNLPAVETYGTQTPMALMRQHIDSGSWYDRSDMGLKKLIVDCQYVACMNHKSGSFLIDPRLQGHFATFACQMPGDADLRTIFGSILTGHFFNFTQKIQSMASNLTEATITLQKDMLLKFLPSATKFHYNFTMRDLSASIKGLLNAKPKEYQSSVQVTRLWYHESMRVFSDRLITDVEVARCREMIINIGKRFMDDDPEIAYVEPCSFTSYVNNPDELGTYVSCDNPTKLKDVLEKKLVEYNESNPIMNLVLFEQAIRHIVRITRILMIPGGNALLVGVGGSGKQSLSKLSAFICHYNIAQIAVTSDYGVSDLKENLRDMYRKAGVKPAIPIMFLLTDSQIADERFLVYINDMLSSGNIPDLFTKEEYDGIFGSLRTQAKAEGIPDNRDSMMTYFVNRVRNNLHIVLCFSPVGETFRQRARKFPGIINCTAIDWFLEWPKDALVSVALKFLEDLETGGGAEIKENIAYHIAEVHTSVGLASVEYLKTEKRYNYTTPKSFLELIEFYKNLLTSRRSELFANIQRLETGLDTLMRTNKDVAILQEFLKEKKKEVEAKKAATDELLEAMGQQRAEAQQQQEVADIEKRKADTAAAQARKLEDQAAGDLAVAKPALDAAVNAVKCLDKNSLTELKTFPKPPPGVDKVTTAVLIMIKLEKKDFSWDNAKKMMAKVDAFKDKLETYRGEDIPEDVVARVQPIIDDPDFTFERMKTKSAAAANLCNWVINIVKFNGIYKRCKPLMDSLSEATKSKRKAEEDLAAVTAILAVIEGKLNALQNSFRLATQEKAKVEAEAKTYQDRLNLAERLTNGLSSEKERWGISVDVLKGSKVTLAGDVMLAAAFASYTGAFGATFRSKLWRESWLADLMQRQVPLTENLDPLWMLTNESRAAEWQNQGLPADRISIENGAIITSCSRWPLLIDPQLQGIRWLKKYATECVEKIDRRLCLLKPGEKMWMMKIVNAIQSGDTVILENVGENLEASLEPILTKSLYRKGKTLYIKVGEDDIEYDENFRLYLQTKLSNPHYKPEISAQCTIINFIVTKKGLEDQLLATIVSEEEPELETTRNSLLQAFNNYKIQLKELEDQLLERLANAPEDILSDIPLIEGLEATKETATEIQEAVKKGKLTEIGINQAREVYRVVATEASLLYFVMLQLNSVDHMYQYSLDSFSYFFLKSLRNAVPSTDKQTRVLILQSTLRWTIFKWVVRGLFARHRLIFLTQYTLSLVQQGIFGDDTGYSTEALRFLLVGYSRAGDGGQSPLTWLNDQSWNGIKNLASNEGFEKLPSDMEENSSRFLEWFQNFTPEDEKLPMDWRELDKTPFKKLLVVRVLRPDRMTAAITSFIKEVVPKGKEFVECDSELSGFQILEQSFEDSSPTIPIYFILSPGSDVVSDVDKLANKIGKTKGVDYHNISLGQGQDVVAQERLEIGARQGHWIVLNNVHLMPRWLNVLEKKIDEWATTGTHEGFRIMLSSDPSNNIPISILDRCIKITSDPPAGLKANLKQAVASFSKDSFEELEPRTKGILFGLCQFHAIVVERKKFGSKGYNMMYPFSIGDLLCSAAVLRNYMESAPAKVPWADLRYLFGEIMYGGHIVNEFDRLLANTYLEYYMKEDLLDEMNLYPYMDKEHENIESFRAPSTGYGYDKIIEHIDETLTTESPVAFGLHPNAEIGFRTRMSDDLLRLILELSASSDDSAGGEGQNSQQVTEALLQEITEQLRDVKFDIDAIHQSIDDVGPFQNVVLQECERMNSLTSEIMRSLIELDLGFRGDLTMSESMEALANSLFLDRVPKRWEVLAYPSMRSLGSWLADLQLRLAQLTEWTGNPTESPIVAWISGLFNPQSFITAVMQKTAQEKTLELDKLSLLVDVTKKMTAEEMTQPAKDGTYITGLFLEGASWNLQNALLEPSKPREMFCPLPVINIKPAIIDRDDKSIFLCPVYKTQQRGPTYVFSIQLRTKYEQAKWVLGGVVSIMDVQ